MHTNSFLFILRFLPVLHFKFAIFFYMEYRAFNNTSHVNIFGGTLKASKPSADIPCWIHLVV